MLTWLEIYIQQSDHPSGGQVSVKRYIMVATVAFCALVPHARAQQNELAGLVGRTFISDQGIKGAPSFDQDLRFGNGLSFEVDYARRLLGGGLLSLGVEVPFVVNPDEDLHAAVQIPEQYRSFFVTPAARLKIFSETPVSPWVSLGGGFGHFSVSSTPNFGAGIGTAKSGTKGVLQIGGGLDVKIIGNFSLRGELRDLWSGVPSLNVDTGKTRQHNLFVAGGLVWRF
jgi:opacity protein-like surface antigen